MALEHSSARELLDAAATARRKTRSILSPNWFPMIVFGALTLVSVPVYGLWSWRAMAAVWVVGAPLASLATALWYRGRELEIGVSVNALPYVLTAVAITAGCMVLGFVGRGSALSYAGPMIVIGFGYVAFAVWDRNPINAVFGAGIACAGVIVFALRPSNAYVVTMMLAGSAAVLLGLTNLLKVRRAG